MHAIVALNAPAYSSSVAVNVFVVGLLASKASDVGDRTGTMPSTIVPLYSANVTDAPGPIVIGVVTDANETVEFAAVEGPAKGAIHAPF